MSSTPDAMGPRLMKSFKDVLQGNVSSELGNIKYDLGNFQGFPALFISDEDMISLAKPFALTLVGKFATTRPPIASIRKFVYRMKFSKNVSVDVHDNLNVIFRFAEEGDYNRFFLHRYYTVIGVCMKVIKWSPFSDISVELPIVPLWLSFPGLRLQMFDKMSLHFLGKMFGKPLSVDASTAACGNISKARILVEIDVTKPIPNKIWIGSNESGFFQSVVVENKPLYCTKCKIFGHEEPCCSIDLQNSSLQTHIPGMAEGSDHASNPPRDDTLLITMGNDAMHDIPGVSRVDPIPPSMNSHELLEAPVVTVEGMEDGAELPVNSGGSPHCSPFINQDIGESFSANILKLGNPMENNTKISTEKDVATEEFVFDSPNCANNILIEATLKELRNMPDPTVLCVVEKQEEEIGNKISKGVVDTLGGTISRERKRETPFFPPHSAVAEDDLSMESNSLLAGYPVSGITTRAMKKLGGGNYSGKCGGEPGNKKNKKGKNKPTGAMAIVLDALLNPPHLYD